MSKRTTIEEMAGELVDKLLSEVGPRRRPDTIEQGDTVQYSRSFLKSIGDISPNAWHAQGVVTGIKDYGSIRLATVNWGPTGDLPDKVNTRNLTNAKFGNSEYGYGERPV